MLNLEHFVKLATNLRTTYLESNRYQSLVCKLSPWRKTWRPINICLWEQLISNVSLRAFENVWKLYSSLDRAFMLQACKDIFSHHWKHDSHIPCNDSGLFPKENRWRFSTSSSLLSHFSPSPNGLAKIIPESSCFGAPLSGIQELC